MPIKSKKKKRKKKAFQAGGLEEPKAGRVRAKKQVPARADGLREARLRDHKGCLPFRR